jgi:hypothetical protein
VKSTDPTPDSSRMVSESSPNRAWGQFYETVSANIHICNYDLIWLWSTLKSKMIVHKTKINVFLWKIAHILTMKTYPKRFRPKWSFVKLIPGRPASPSCRSRRGSGWLRCRRTIYDTDLLLTKNLIVCHGGVVYICNLRYSLRPRKRNCILLTYPRGGGNFLSWMYLGLEMITISAKEF